ncbi:hypothetical protein MTO96_043705, partial [Rhipicephalus appendiculatus]
CRRYGYIRRGCQTPCCSGYRAFGHVRDDCARTHASVIAASPAVKDSHENLIDADEAESTTSTKGDDTLPSRPKSTNDVCWELTKQSPRPPIRRGLKSRTWWRNKLGDLTEDSKVPVKHPREDARTLSGSGSNRKQQRLERPSLKVSSQKDTASAMSQSASLERGERRR